MRGIVLAERTPTSCQYFAGLQTFAVLELGLVLIPVSIQNEAADLLIQLVCYTICCLIFKLYLFSQLFIYIYIYVCVCVVCTNVLLFVV